MNEDVKKTVANNLTVLRKSKNMTQSDLAKLLNYSDKSVSKWEHADSLPDIEILCTLCDIYGVSLDFLTHENASEHEELLQNQTKQTTGNRITITLLTLTTIFLIATIIFVYSILVETKAVLWQAYVWALPVCFVFLQVFNQKWFKSGALKIVFQSFTCWTLLTCIFLTDQKLWLIFILGIPIQIIIILFNNLSNNKRKY